MNNSSPFSDEAVNKIYTRFEYREDEFELIKKGCPRPEPYNQDYSKWSIETKDNWVYILRSLSQSTVFKIHFVKKDNVYVSDDAYMIWGQIKEDDKTSFIQKSNYYNCWMFFLIEYLIFKNPYAFMDNGGFGTKIDFNGIHGFSHWKNVNMFGNKIADKNGADKTIIYFFSVLHDYFRVNQDGDYGHGERAVGACNLFLEYLNKDQVEILQFAVKNHNLSPEEISKIDSPLNKNITVYTCLDSDRLDLPRVGISVDKKCLFTNEAKKIVESGV